MEQDKDRREYQQQTLTGLEEETYEETILEHCIVESLPMYRKNGRGYEWDCAVYCPPDIFHQERNEYYQAHAKTFAKEAHKKHLRPGDAVLLKGQVFQQTIETMKGETKTINHISVSDMEVISRAKRESITVYEKKRGK
jgi:hypothetical protein